MKIINFKAENVKRISAVEITPDGNMVVIGGNNGHGKTSILDSIMWALGGKKTFCERPLKDGAEKGKTILDLGEYVITRTYTEKGGTIKVENKDGAKYGSPQGVLDKLTGDLTFDPVQFASMPAKDQLETLKQLVGLDFTELDMKRKRIYDARTEVGRDGKALSAKFDSMQLHEGVEKIDITETFKKIQDIEAQNRDNDKDRRVVSELERSLNLWSSEQETLLSFEKAIVKTMTEEIDYTTKDIQKLESEIEIKKQSLKTQHAQKKAKILENKEFEDSINKELTQKKSYFHKERNRVSLIEDKKTDKLNLKIESAEEINKKVQENADFENTKKQKEDLATEWQNKTEEIKAIDDDKAGQLKSAEFPIDDLSFDSSGVLYQNIPFSQASAAEKLRVSVAMGVAMSPKLKVMLIRDASLLDDDNMNILAEMAEEHDVQLWIERVGKGAECSVIIEDGMVER